MADSNSKKKTGYDSNDEQKIIPVIREEVVTDKRMVKKATILIRKGTRTEEAEFDIPLSEDKYDIERIPVNRYIDSKPEIRLEGDTTVIPVLKEVVVKRLLLTEEIRITRKVLVTKKTGKAKLRNDEVTVTRKENHQRF